jgi:mRNA interferase MazF
MAYDDDPEVQPQRGHFIWADFTPHADHEQAGRRPAIVLSQKIFNIGTGRLIACPITNQMRGGPFEVPLPPGMKPTGAVLVDQVRAIDWRARNASFIGVASAQFLDQVFARLAAILGMRYK